MVGTEICRDIDTLISQEEEIQIGLRKILNEVVDLAAWRRG